MNGRRCHKPDMTMRWNVWKRRAICWTNEHIKSAANRAYYAVFHAMRAVLAYDDIDMKHHSGIISSFRRLYIKTGVFDVRLSTIISELYDLRTGSDYDDFFIVSGAEVAEQTENAEFFLKEIKRFLEGK